MAVTNLRSIFAISGLASHREIGLATLEDKVLGYYTRYCRAKARKVSSADSSRAGRKIGRS